MPIISSLPPAIVQVKHSLKPESDSSQKTDSNPLPDSTISFSSILNADARQAPSPLVKHTESDQSPKVQVTSVATELTGPTSPRAAAILIQVKQLLAQGVAPKKIAAELVTTVRSFLQKLLESQNDSSPASAVNNDITPTPETQQQAGPAFESRVAAMLQKLADSLAATNATSHSQADSVQANPSSDDGATALIEQLLGSSTSPSQQETSSPTDQDYRAHQSKSDTTANELVRNLPRLLVLLTSLTISSPSKNASNQSQPSFQQNATAVSDELTMAVASEVKKNDTSGVHLDAFLAGVIPPVPTQKNGLRNVHPIESSSTLKNTINPFIQALSVAAPGDQSLGASIKLDQNFVSVANTTQDQTPALTSHALQDQSSTPITTPQPSTPINAPQSSTPITAPQSILQNAVVGQAGQDAAFRALGLTAGVQQDSFVNPSALNAKENQLQVQTTSVDAVSQTTQSDLLQRILERATNAATMRASTLNGSNSSTLTSGAGITTTNAFSASAIIPFIENALSQLTAGSGTTNRSTLFDVKIPSIPLTSILQNTIPNMEQGLLTNSASAGRFTLPVLPADVHNIVGQILTGITIHDVANSPTVHINLTPPQLGEISLRIQVSADQKVSATIITSSAEVRATLLAHTEQLAKSLNDAGLKLSQLAVDLSGQDMQQKRQNSSDFQKNAQTRRQVGAIDEPQPSSVDSMPGPSMLDRVDLQLLNHLV